MDNQHETCELAYLAGIIDGEGSCIVSRHKDKKNYRYRYGYRVALSNTDLLIISACTGTLDRLEVTYSCYEQDRRKTDAGRNHCTIHLIIANKAGILTVAAATIPFLTGKRIRMQKLAAACRVWTETSREQKEALYQEFKRLNARVPRGKTRIVRGHTRRTLANKDEGEEMVQTATINIG